MTGRTGKVRKKAPPKKDRAWFERKLAELKAEVDKARADLQEQSGRGPKSDWRYRNAEH
jgi:hypothetical protein